MNISPGSSSFNFPHLTVIRLMGRYLLTRSPRGSNPRGVSLFRAKLFDPLGALKRPAYESALLVSHDGCSGLFVFEELGAAASAAVPLEVELALVDGYLLEVGVDAV